MGWWVVRILLLFDNVFWVQGSEPHGLRRRLPLIRSFSSRPSKLASLWSSRVRRGILGFFSPSDGRFVSLLRSGLYGRISVEEVRVGVWG